MEISLKATFFCMRAEQKPRRPTYFTNEGRGLVYNKKQENDWAASCRASLVTATVLALIFFFNGILHSCSCCHVNIIDMTTKGGLGLLELLLMKDSKDKPNLSLLTLWWVKHEVSLEPPRSQAEMQISKHLSRNLLIICKVHQDPFVKHHVAWPLFSSKHFINS